MKNLVRPTLLVSFGALAIALLAIPRSARPQGNNPVTKLDPALDAIVPADLKIEKVAGDFAFTEGPVWSRASYLLFSDIPNNVINKWTPDGKVSVYLDKSGYSGTVTLKVPKPFHPKSRGPYMIGSNGLTFDRTGALIVCEHGNRRVERIDNEGKRSFVAESYNGKRLNSPNDVIVRSDNSIYFTDPPFGLQATNSKAELPFAGVYRVKDEKVELLTKELSGPNGLAFSPYEKYLYVDDSNSKKYFRYEMNPDGSLGPAKLIYDASKDGGDGVPDGMKVDTTGNLYATGPAGLYIFAMDGNLLGKIKFPEQPSNLAWGDVDGKTLFVTARTSVYRIRLNVAGSKP